MIGGAVIALGAWAAFLAWVGFQFVRFLWQDHQAQRRIIRLTERDRERDELEDEFALPAAPNPRWLA